MTTFIFDCNIFLFNYFLRIPKSKRNLFTEKN